MKKQEIYFIYKRIASHNQNHFTCVLNITTLCFTFSENEKKTAKAEKKQNKTKKNDVESV